MKLSLLIYGLICIAAGSQCYVSAFEAPSEDPTSLSQADPVWEDWDKEVRISKRDELPLDDSASGFFIFQKDPLFYEHEVCISTMDCDAVDSTTAEATIIEAFTGLYNLMNSFPNDAIVETTYRCTGETNDTYACLCDPGANSNQLTVTNLFLDISGVTIKEEAAKNFNDRLDFMKQLGQSFGNDITTCNSSTIRYATAVNETKRHDVKCQEPSATQLRTRLNRLRVDITSLSADYLGNTLRAVGSTNLKCNQTKEGGLFTGDFKFNICNFAETSGTYQNNDTVTFSNYLLDENDQGLYVACVYIQNFTNWKLLSSLAWNLIESQVVITRRDLGTFSLKMGLYSDPLYMNELSETNAIGRDDYIYGQVYALGIDMDINNLRFSLQNCFDSSAQLRFSDDIEHHALIQDRCPIEESYETIPTNQNDMYKFRFKPGTQYNLDEHLHLHCDIKVCTVDDNSEDCKPPDERECARVNKRIKRSLHHGDNAPLSIGPISFTPSSKTNSEETIFERTNRSNKQDETTPVTLTPFLLVIAVAAVAINVAMATIYIIQSRTKK